MYVVHDKKLFLMKNLWEQIFRNIKFSEMVDRRNKIFHPTEFIRMSSNISGKISEKIVKEILKNIVNFWEKL